LIEDKEFSRSGETVSPRVDFRVIAASNRDLEVEVRKGNFRSDLYYRLKVIKFVLPPLEERKEDIPLLIEHFLINSDIQNDFRDFDFKPYLECHWPGNVRELENEITRLSTFTGDLKFSKNLELLKDDTNFKMSFYDKIAEFEKEQIIEALRICNNIKSQAAKMLNIPEATLHRKIRMYDIKL